MEQREQGSIRPASLGRALKRAFGDTYDRLGLVLGASLIWFLSISAPIMLGAQLSVLIAPVFFVLGLIAAFFLGAAVTAGVFVLAHNLVTRQDPVIGDIRAGFSELFFPAVRLALVDVIITGVLLADIAFLFGLIGAAEITPSPIMLMIGILFLYLFLVWIMSMLYHFPELVWRRSPTFTILRRGFLLLADNVFFTTGLLFVIILLTILCAITFVGMAALFIGAAAVVTTSCLRELFIKYGIVEEPPEITDDGGWPGI